MEVDQDLMYLDEEAIHSLDLVESKKTMYRTGKSLFSVLNRCKTAGGKSLLENWLQHPLTNIDLINRRLDIVEILFNNNTLRDSIGDGLSRIPDLKRLISRLSSKKCTLLDCCKIYQSLFSINNIIQIIESEQNKLLNDEFLTELKDMQIKCKNYSNLIDTTVDKASLDNGDPIIDPSLNGDLADINDQMEEQKMKAEKVYRKTCKELHGSDIEKVLKLEYDSIYGFAFRLTLKNEELIRGNKKYQILGTKKDGVRFTTDDLSKYSDGYLEVRKKYENAQSTIFEQLLITLRTYCEPIDLLNNILAKLDVYYSIADCSKYGQQSYVRPKLLPKGTGKIKFTNLRHPCLENQINVYYIPNSIDFDKDNKKFFIVTGPNMGGKSTFIKSLGVAILMAQIGSFIPADQAEISIVDGIFTRIGASDKQFKGISTFKAEMLETAEILKRATEDSLVIIDELGRGTSTFDGCGLAYSISKEIASKIKSYCLFATHFHELTLLANEVSSVENLFVNYEFDEKNCELKMLYQVEKGVCDQKFGIHVAKMVMFPESMIKFAQEKVKKYESIENPENKDQLEKLSNLIKEKSKEIPNLKEMSDEDLFKFLNQLVEEVK